MQHCQLNFFLYILLTDTGEIPLRCLRTVLQTWADAYHAILWNCFSIVEVTQGICLLRLQLDGHDVRAWPLHAQQCFYVAQLVTSRSRITSAFHEDYFVYTGITKWRCFFLNVDRLLWILSSVNVKPGANPEMIP